MACGESGCILPQRVCSRDVQCPRAIYDAICNNSKLYIIFGVHYLHYVCWE